MIGGREVGIMGVGGVSGFEIRDFLLPLWDGGGNHPSFFVGAVLRALLININQTFL